MKKLLFLLFIIIFTLTACQNEHDTSAFKVSDDVQSVNHSIKEKEEITIVKSVEEPSENEDENGDRIEPNDDEQTEEERNIVVVDNPNSINVIVNKNRKLPDGFVPPNLVEPNVPFSFSGQDEKRQLQEVAARALEELFEAAKEDGIELFAVSGYRSYDRQYSIYNWNVNNYGQAHADQYSAKPGHSEHQTGLTMDVSAAVVSYQLIEDFGKTDEGLWLEQNAHKHGFVIRYPEGKSDITGYSYEPWHLRYFGTETATEIFESGLTVEEYFGFVN
ncbi:M15 family metallopeptidase [Bacillaceae bacterium W0354]